MCENEEFTWKCIEFESYARVNVVKRKNLEEQDEYAVDIDIDLDPSTGAKGLYYMDFTKFDSLEKANEWVQAEARKEIDKLYSEMTKEIED